MGVFNDSLVSVFLAVGPAIVDKRRGGANAAEADADIGRREQRRYD